MMAIDTKRLHIVPMQPDAILRLADGCDAIDGFAYSAEPIQVLHHVAREQSDTMRREGENTYFHAVHLFVRRNEGDIIGSACFKGVPDAEGCVEIGYGMGEAHRCQGYATEAVRALCMHALHCGAKRVKACTEPGNTASMRVFQKCGFERMGECAGEVQFALTPHPFFACPICHGSLVRMEGSLVCAKRHTHDMARQGHVNLLAKQTAGLYEGKALFAARRHAYARGFFDPLVSAMRDAIGAKEGTVVLDAGCGEGSLLASVLHAGQHGVGLDIGKQAIAMAAGAYKGIAFCVGDLCNMPLPDASVDVLLNVLTPANYGEFARVLRPGGTIIKVMPQSDHLKELRSLLGKENSSELSDAEDVFLRHVRLVNRQKVRYTVACDAELYASAYAMTPLTAGTDAPQGVAGDITVDVMILTGGYT